MPNRIKNSRISHRNKLLLVNGLTFSRLVLTFVICGALQSGALFMALATFAVICLTDYFDGWLARNWNCTTKAGAVLDAISDLWYVLAVSTTLKIMGLLPDLYILIIMLKFGEFTVTSRFLRQRVKGTGTFVYDRLGRATAVLFFAIPGVAILSRILGGNTMVSVKSLVFATGCMAVLSSIGRIEACFGTNRINGGNPLWIRNS